MKSVKDLDGLLTHLGLDRRQTLLAIRERLQARSHDCLVFEVAVNPSFIGSNSCKCLLKEKNYEWNSSMVCFLTRRNVFVSTDCVKGPLSVSFPV